MSDQITRPIGEIFTTTKGVTLKVVEKRDCIGCFYNTAAARCQKDLLEGAGTCSIDRSDRTGVIFERVMTEAELYSALRDQYAEKQAELDDTTARLEVELASLDIRIRDMESGNPELAGEGNGAE